MIGYKNRICSLTTYQRRAKAVNKRRKAAIERVMKASDARTIVEDLEMVRFGCEIKDDFRKMIDLALETAHWSRSPSAPTTWLDGLVSGFYTCQVMLTVFLDSKRGETFSPCVNHAMEEVAKIIAERQHKPSDNKMAV